ncbi:MAG: hypothetical protein WCI51_00195 [Lentisphaerota bacterium]
MPRYKRSSRKVPRADDCSSAIGDAMVVGIRKLKKIILILF